MGTHRSDSSGIVKNSDECIDQLLAGTVIRRADDMRIWDRDAVVSQFSLDRRLGGYR